jgi:hypothetical protein
MHHSTRRDVIRTGIVGTAAAVAGGAVLRDPAAAGADVLAGARGDPALVYRLAVIEQLIAFAYGYVIARIPLSADTGATLRDFASHEREHVRRLAVVLRDLGHAPPPAPTDAASVSRQLTSLHGSGSLTSFARQIGALEYLVGVETVAEGAHYSAISQFSDPSLVMLSAQILGCEAQHWSTLEGLLHPGEVMQSVPYSTVHG